MPITFTEPLYSLREVAEELGIAIGTVRAHIQHGVLEAERMPDLQRTRMIRASELERFKRDRRPVGVRITPRNKTSKENSQTR